jgi:hypothetical protein
MSTVVRLAQFRGVTRGGSSFEIERLRAHALRPGVNYLALNQ